MKTALQYVLSVIFIAQMYAAMVVLAVWWTPIALFRRDAAFDAKVKTYQAGQPGPFGFFW